MYGRAVVLMRLSQALGIRPKEVVCLVGAGGKTTLMFSLAKELAVQGKRVITTTTTKIQAPSPELTEQLIIEKNDDILVQRAAGAIRIHHHITVASGGDVSSKLVGITPETAVALSQIEGVSHLLIEGDGAARRSLKAPRHYEPVIPPNTSLVIAIAGIDVLGNPLDEKNVFRSEVAAGLLRVPMGTVVSPEMMARLMTCPGGIPKGAPAAAAIVPFINKVDLEGGIEKGRQVARTILAEQHPQIPCVLLGQALHPNPVVEMQQRLA
jgi:probable selenium-dependent hydroxylase accessory protein YqeC